MRQGASYALFQVIGFLCETRGVSALQSLWWIKLIKFNVLIKQYVILWG